MKSRTSGYSSDSEQTKQQDLSILRKPILTALNGFLEAKRAYENGTEEIRRLLSRECDIMYECKVCRNVFRSLTNFISHKRIYCRTINNNLTNYNSNGNGFIDQDISTIIQAEQDFVNKSTIKDNKINENSNKDLSSIIERLLKREQANRLLKLTDFYEQVSNKLTQDEVLRKKHTLQLDRVPNSDVAVYQTVKKTSDDNIKKEITEITDLLLKNKTVIGPDGKVMEPLKDLPVEEYPFGKKEDSTENDEVTCDVCHTKFATEKTLKLHIQAKHIQSTFVYQCPSCSLTFLQPGSVIRHLNNDHKKSLRRIRLMRESIYKKRIRADEVTVKGPSRELARLQSDKDKQEADNKEWMENIERFNSSPMCTYCGKTFERKAVLTTHLNNCAMKNKASIVTRKSNEIPNAMKGDVDTKGQNIDQNDSEFDKEIPAQSKTKHNSNPGINNDCNTVNNLISIDLTEDDPVPPTKGKRKKAPKILIKNDSMDVDFLDDSFWNLDRTDDLTLKTVSFDDLTIKEEIDDSKKIDDIVIPIKSEKCQPEKCETLVKSETPTQVGKSVAEVVTKPATDVYFFCKICEKRFDAISNLRRHISMFHYRRRKFGCKLCDYRAFRRYDVINHLNSIHSLIGDREAVLEFVIVKEEKVDRCEDVDDDVIVSQNGMLSARTPSLEKRTRRGRVPKILKPSPDIVTVSSVKTEKFTRSSSSISFSSNEDSLPTPSKRPIRNRVKPVNKDFVYDLSNLLKKDMVLSERDCSTTLVPAKTQKRRNTSIIEDTNSKDNIPTSTNGEVEIKPIKPSIKGAAFAMAQAAVKNHIACFNEPPEIPLERPPLPVRLINSSRTSEPSLSDASPMKDESSNDMQSRSKLLRRVSDDSIIKALSKKRKIENGSPNALFSPGKKSDINLNGGKKSPSKEQNFDSDKITVLCPTEKEFQEYLVANKLTEPVKKVAVTPYIEPAIQENITNPTKRITLMQRLVDNKQKKLQESLLRTALEN